MAGEIDAHPTEEVGALSAHLEPDRDADLLLQFEVPRRPAGHGHREGRGGSHDDAARAIREPKSGNAKALDVAHHDRRGVVAIGKHVGHALPEGHVAIEQVQLLVGGEPSEQLLDDKVDGLTAPNALDARREHGLGARHRHEAATPSMTAPGRASSRSWASSFAAIFLIAFQPLGIWRLSNIGRGDVALVIGKTADRIGNPIQKRLDRSHLLAGGASLSQPLACADVKRIRGHLHELDTVPVGIRDPRLFIIVEADAPGAH